MIQKQIISIKQLIPFCLLWWSIHNETNHWHHIHAFWFRHADIKTVNFLCLRHKTDQNAILHGQNRSPDAVIADNNLSNKTSENP